MVSHLTTTVFFFCIFLPFSSQLLNSCTSFFPSETTLANTSLLLNSITLPQILIDDGYTAGDAYSFIIQVMGDEKVNAFFIQVQNEDNTPIGTFLTTNRFQSVITCQNVNDSLADSRLTSGQDVSQLNLTSIPIRWLSPTSVHLPTSALSVVYTLGINRMLYQRFQSPSFSLKDFCSPSPCQNSGSCVSLMTGGYTCVCPLSYFGLNCQSFNACASSPCLNDGVCSDRDFGFSCSCPPGYSGRQCEIDINECQSVQDPCGINGACIDESNSYSCKCGFGFSGNRCQENIEDCRSELCGAGVCVDLVGDYMCICNGSTAGRNCNISHGCSISENECMNNAICGEGTVRCLCLPGFTGPICGTSINHCLSEPCRNGGICHDLVETYLCECLTGFEGADCSIDIDECEDLTICNNGLCVNTGGSYDCYCSNGFAGGSCDLNIPDCFNNPCAEFSTCVDGIGEFTCSCPLGRTGVLCESNVDLCLGEPCRNNATCIDGVFTYSCACMEGFTGGSCEVELDECVSSPCLNNGTCIDRVNAFECMCRNGFTGACCELDINECSSDPCENDGKCLDGINDFMCDCTPGFTNKTCSDDVDECAESLCENNSTCTNTLGSFTCICQPGFIGSRCSNDIDECSTISQPCMNGGECVNTLGNYSCNCLPSYKGSRCQTFVPSCENFDTSGNSLDCENNGTCVQSEEGVTCQCIPGYTGMFCETSFDPCLNASCSAISTCMSLGDTYTCICPPGITGEDCATDIMECEQNVCLNGGFCLETFGSFICACNEFFRGDRCEIARNICQSQPCFNNGTCESNRPGTLFFNCTCQLGFTGGRCEIQIDYCQPNPCNNNGSCMNATHPITIGTPLYTCACPPGYTGDNCSQDVDECLLAPCSNNGSCVNTAGGYLCDCLPGYNGTRCEQEILECQLLSPCRNNGSCIEQIAGYSCLCTEGFTGENCSEKIDFCANVTCNTGMCVSLDDGYRCLCPQGVTGPNCATDILECASQPCMNNGMCTEAFGTFMCSCLPGFNGSVCEQVIGSCTPTPCQNGGICRDDPDERFLCFCRLGFTGKFCHININDCVGSPCLNGGSCEDGIASFSCNCSTGFEGKICSIDIDSCNPPNPCINNGTCTDLSGADRFMCSCPTGYTGEGCREDIDDCVGRNCSDRGLCLDMLDGYMCNCENGYTGRNCEDKVNVCASSPCQNGGNCVDEFPFFQCQCLPGFTDELCGTDIDECATDPCGEGITCIDDVNAFICLCPPGYTGSTCNVQIVECRSSPCLNNGTCMEVDESGFVCNCMEGFTGNVCGDVINFCELESYTSNPCVNGRCVSTSEGFICVCNESLTGIGYTGRLCDTLIDACTSNPCENGVCRTVNENSVCLCYDGFSGELCETNIDDCASSPCQNNASCVNRINGTSCICSQGYTGTYCEERISLCSTDTCMDGGTCIDDVTEGFKCVCPLGQTGVICEIMILFCRNNSCLNNGTCENIRDGYQCVCRPGFTGDRCEAEFNSCSNSSCSNNATCIPTDTGFTCACPDDYYGAVCQYYNNCIAVNCNNGACINGLNSTSKPITSNSSLLIYNGLVACLCLPGYTGRQCDSLFDPCEEKGDALCSNRGTCVFIGGGKYTCDCEFGYCGSICQTAIQSVRFSGNSYLELASISNPLHQYSIDLSIQTNDSSALLLYTAQNTSQNEQFFDFTLLQIISGQVRAIVDSGTGPGTAQTNFKINDGMVHNISIVREGREIRLTVDDKTFTDQTNGINDQQQLPLPLFLGGISDYSTLPGRYQGLNGFTGCVHSLTISSQNIALTRNVTNSLNTETCKESVCGYLRCENGGTCVEDMDALFRCECREGYTGTFCEVLALSCVSHNGSNTSGIAIDDTIMRCLNGGTCKQIEERFTCVCPLGYIGNSCQRASQIDSPFFSGEVSYLFFTSFLDLSLTFDISLSFRAFSPSGILLYSSQFTSPTPGDYTLLQLYNGYVHFMFDCGSGPLNLSSMAPVALNTWHTVRIVRIGRLGHLYVNSQQPVSGFSLGAFIRLNLGENLYIGGIDRSNVALPATIQHSMGLVGCIGHINTSSMPLILSQATGGFGVNSCPDSRCNITHCLNGGTCLEYVSGQADEVACSCQLGYGGDRCQNVIDVCVADNPCQAGGLCRTIGEGESFICLCPLWKDGQTCEEDVTPILPKLSTPYSFIEFPIPPHISLQSWNKIDLSITLDFSTTLLPESNLRSMAFLGSLESNDFIALLLQFSPNLSEHPQLQLKYNIGSGTQTVIGPAIQPDILYNVCLTRYQNQFTLSINDSVILKASSPGTNTALNLALPVIRIGALSAHFQQLVSPVNATAVRGCMHRISVNLFQFGITSVQGAEGRAISDCLQDICLNSQPCLNSGRCVQSGTSVSSSLVCLCRFGYIGDNCGEVLSITTASLSSYSSILFQPIPGPISDNLIMSFPIKLDMLSGVLLLATNQLESEFIRLVLSEGVLVLTTHLTEATSSQPLLPSRWYNLTLILNQQKVAILIDGNAYLELNLSNDVQTITSSALDMFTIGSSILSQQSFQGCIGNVTVIHDDVTTLFTANEGWGISQCVFSDQCSTSVCSEHGLCRLSQDFSFVCSCYAGFSGDLCEIALFECDTGVVGCLNEGSCRVQLVGGIQQFECRCQLPFSGDKCQFNSTFTSAYFNANSYLAFPSLFLSSFKSSTIIELTVMAESGDGVLFFAENIMGTSRQDYIYIGLRNSRVEFRFDLGTGSATLLSRQAIQLGKPALIRANRNLQSGELYIDGKLESSGISPGSSTYFSANTDIFLGGVPNHDLISPFGSPRGFQGCIGSFRVGFQTNTIPIPFSSATSGIDVRQC